MLWSSRTRGTPFSSSKKYSGELLPMPDLSSTGTSERSAEKRLSTTASTIAPLSPVPVGSILPPPAIHDSSLSSCRRKQKKTARINGGGLRVHWALFKKRIGTGTAPSTSSIMVESSGESSIRRPVLVKANTIDDNGEVDEVIVDRTWSDEIKSTVTQSEQGGSPEKTTSHQQGGAASTDHESFAVHIDGFWSLWSPFIILRWRMWPAVIDFFTLSFFDERSEGHYRKENWFIRKSLALWASLFYVLNWVLACAFVPRPLVLADNIFFFGIATALTIPLPVMVIYDFPRDRSNFYQIFLCISTWSWSLYQLFFMYFCGFYTDELRHSYFTCGNKDFLGTFYWSTGLATIALFGLKQNRLPAMIGALAWFIIACALILPDRVTWTRNVLNHFVYQSFLLWVHYSRENAERRLYTLRDQLKIQFRATQKAQVNERKASDSKRRLTSYVFHDKYLLRVPHLAVLLIQFGCCLAAIQVRVPLNTALLATQNMDAAGTVPKAQQIEFKALEGSLSMMSKVLNDVLDFNRMDSGRFESVAKPYSLQHVMRSMLVPLRLATDARNLKLVTEWDKSIDIIARRAAYEAMGLSPGDIIKRIEESPDEDGLVVGDESRLRQVITNLASNACKFTQAGGQLTVKTQLILPDVLPPVDPAAIEAPPQSDLDDTTELTDGSNGEYDASDVEKGFARRIESQHVLSANHLSQHNLHHSKPPPLEWIVVRIEVTDTGCGIKPKDMIESKLFSAFNQTEQGRQQGGKGTGLGLALVRQIVKLSRGRLGVRSKVGEGSTFWVELPLGIGAKAIEGVSPPPNLVERTPDELGISSRFSGEGQSSFREARGSRNSSAFTTIMEQGGLVELIPSKPGEAPVLTRTIGDPSTGTAATHYSTPESEYSSSDVTPSQTPRTNRPSHVDLPKPRTFTSFDTPTPSTVFSVTSSNPAGRVNSPPSSPPAEFDPGMNVLVVDDDPMTRLLMKRLLTRIGCHVTTAENGEIALDMLLNGYRPTPSSETPSSGSINAPQPVVAENTGVQIAEESRFAVVFLDNQMPVMSGLDTVQRLREVGRNDFVVGVTGNALLTDQEEYLNAGVDRVLTKPVLEKSLRSMLALADARRKRTILDYEPPTKPS